MDQDRAISRYDGAVLLLPPQLREWARSLTGRERAAVEEIRLRSGQRMTVVIQDEEQNISREKVTLRDIDTVIELATGASAHAALSQMKAGFVTARGGYRIGICGSVVVSNGQVSGFKTISSLVIRISREISNIALPLVRRMGGFDSTLIISPPGGGKTTLLRDMVRILSDGVCGTKPLRIALADERGEIAAMMSGMAQMDVGRNTDILDGCPKAEAMTMMLRAMNPHVLALDEITAAEDITSMIQASNCGVKLLATAHAYDASDLLKRPLYKKLMSENVFKNIIIIRNRSGERSFELKRSEEIC